MRQLIDITDSKLIKITKVKSYAIYFNYNGDRYLLHNSANDDCDTTTLYLREPIGNCGKFKLVVLSSKYGNSIPVIRYKGKRKTPKNSKSPAYSLVDVEKFIWDMAWNEFFTGKYGVEVAKRKDKLRETENAIKLLIDLKMSLRKL